MAKERPPLEEMTLRQLRRVASECGISRYSRMRKSQLLAAIQEVQRSRISPSQSNKQEVQEAVEATKFEVGQEDNVGEDLSSVDEGLAELPGGYGESLIVLLPRDPQWAYAYWDIPNDRKEELRRAGGQQIALRLYDVTDINLDSQSPHSIQEYPCDELAREWYLPVPVSDRDYVVDIGYRTADGRWLVLARSEAVRVPPLYPSDWVEEQFITVSWDEELRGRKLLELDPASKRITVVQSPIDKIFAPAADTEAQRIAGSLFGSMQQVPGSISGVSSYAVSSYAVSSYEVSSYAVSSYFPAVSSYGVSSYGVSSYTAAVSSYGVSSYGVSSYSVSSYVPAVSSYGVSSYVPAVSSYGV
ncbi:MAG TPA: Rho termination protein, partial [Cyanobacteria bacterium UBA11369]|nr:Rho termination protein [Cyanobacteria bacterium UBA11369]